MADIWTIIWLYRDMLKTECIFSCQKNMNVYGNPYKERIMHLTTVADSYGYCRKNRLEKCEECKVNQICEKHF